MANAIKDYLGYENARNRQHADLYQALVQIAYGADCDVLTGHHVTFEKHGDISTENEIPSADTLIFDHEIMGRVFGENAIPLMQKLAAVPCDQRDDMVRIALAAR